MYLNFTVSNFDLKAVSLNAFRDWSVFGSDDFGFPERGS
jgi:hypothetical protein